MRAIETVSTVEIPENVTAALDGRVVTIKGEKGELTRDFSHAPVQISLDGKTIFSLYVKPVVTPFIMFLI